ncbi:MAG: 2-amino-4-hydroxy-6-hydroxymethyldihydropteridine diphosphokinase [Lentimicrobiaceae bacterium]|nr:2-amino-4-hydroxy-6-hydroxymethyldihydropteridine diphosphokinase [Lentimicrobiaceae bacterium]
MAFTFLSLGSNLGNRLQHLQKARNAIQEQIGAIVSESSIYETEAVGFAGNMFCNQVIKVETALTPDTLLQKTQEIEKNLGRTQKTVTQNNLPVYTNRIIDIDILLYDDLQINTENLTIPHPRMLEREFVMKPLKEIMPAL